MANILSLLIFIAVPSLLKITSPTGSIDVIVDGNVGVNCDTSQLSTRTTVSDGNSQ